ncbi:MAG: hypothetical protein K8R64_01515 [Methanosarcinaceae archaeon]|nr:hypothetical protein [Methanosarcinaceae archaeon]
MKLCEFTRSDSAMSTVVSAVLLLGLFVSVISIVNTSYIPVWKGDAEFSHMGDVFDDMSQVKSRADILSVALTMDPDTSMSMSIPVQMGGGSIPIFSSGRSSGTLSLNNDQCAMVISGRNQTNGSAYEFAFNDLGSVVYHSNNNFYVDQSYVYENGAFIVSQKDRSLMRLLPSIYFRGGDEQLNVTINSIRLMGARKTISSNGIEYVRLISNETTSFFDGDEMLTNVSIHVNTNYPSAWINYFNSSAEDVGLKYSINYSVSAGIDHASIDLFPNNMSIGLYLDRTTIDAMVNPI